MTFPLTSAFFKKSGGGFRFLHDEISGGIVSFSHLKTKAAYAGNCFRVSSTDFGFGVDNFADLTGAASSFPSPATCIYFDQIENYDSESSVNGWSGSDFMVDKGIKTASFDSLSSSSPFTALLVLNKSSDNTGSEECFLELTGSGLNFRLFYNTGNLLRVGWFSPGIWLNNYSGIRSSTTGLKIICITYDGSETLAGINIYVNDMVTPLSVSSTTGSAPSFTAASFSSVGFFSRQAGNFPINNSINSDPHVFNSELSEADRQKAKAILEQYYTFS